MDKQSIQADGDHSISSPIQLFIAILNGHYHSAQKLVFLYKRQRERLLKNTAFYSSDKSERRINLMKNASFWKKLFEEILANKEYSVARIAEELSMPYEIITSFREGNMQQEPSFSVGVQLLELHCKVRNDLHQ